MRRRRLNFLLSVAIFSSAATLASVAAAQVTGTGSLYPPEADAPVQLISKASVEPGNNTTAVLASPRMAENRKLAKALGPAGYILNSVGVTSEFSAIVRQAVGRHPAFHSQVSALDETRAERRRASSALYPQLSTQFRGDYSIARDFGQNTDNAVEALRPREQFTAGISASQLVFDGGATFQRIKSARARNSEFKNAISTRINDLSLASLAAYHDYATHQALLSLGDAFILRHAKILDDVKERERLGAGSKADVTRAIARLAAAQARVAEIRESKQLAEIRYLEFFGETPGILHRPSFDAFAVETRDQAVTAALMRSPEIAVASARADASQADYRAAKGARLPEVRVSVDAVKFDLFDSGDDFDVRAGVNLNYNIFGGGARSADIAQAASRARQSQFGADQIRQEVARDAAIAFERAQGAAARLKALETAVVAHDETRELVLERYRVARGDLIDVLQAENDYFESGVAYLTGLANRDMAVYGVMEHTGELLRFFSPQEEYADIMGGVGNG
ncbi:MAG: TolC family protein [Pseudomonadota bacterium]